MIMGRELVPITLPWKRPRKGLMVAELGATFQVERTERGWQVSVRSGKRIVLLAKDLTRQRDGQCRAEAHAATMPEVIAALENQAVESASSETKGRHDGASSAASGDPTGDARPEPTQVAPASPIDAQDSESIDYARVDDGCICGRATSGTWAADPKGHVARPHDTPPEEADRIRRFAATYFERQSQRASPPAKPAPRSSAPPAASTTKASKAAKKPVRASRPSREETAKPKPTKPSRASKPAAGQPGAQKAGRKVLAKKIAKGRSASASPPQQPSGKSVQPTAVATGSTPAQRLAKARQAKAAKAKSKAPAPEPKPPEPKAKPTARQESAAPPETPRPHEPKAKRAARKGRGAQADAPASSTTGCAMDLQWFQVEGRPRANTPFGSFAIEPEGDRQALYFYDLNGMSTFITDRGDLRQIAAERAARGGVTPTMTQRSPELDAQMRNLFFSEDMR
jgi:hypothetical protein